MPRRRRLIGDWREYIEKHMTEYSFHESALSYQEHWHLGMRKSSQSYDGKKGWEVFDTCVSCYARPPKRHRHRNTRNNCTNPASPACGIRLKHRPRQNRDWVRFGVLLDRSCVRTQTLLPEMRRKDVSQARESAPRLLLRFYLVSSQINVRFLGYLFS